LLQSCPLPPTKGNKEVLIGYCLVFLFFSTKINISDAILQGLSPNNNKTGWMAGYESYIAAKTITLKTADLVATILLAAKKKHEQIMSFLSTNTSIK
jgi:hypothetical protein